MSYRTGRYLFPAALFLFCFFSARPAAAEEAVSGVFMKLPAFFASDRVLILAPHPDDEAIACAGVIKEALRRGAFLKVAYLTNGDHNQLAFLVYKKRPVLRTGEFIQMGEVRRREAVKAMGSLGVPEKDLVFLGYPDFGTFSIFCKYWKSRKPYKSILTRISAVPYKDNFSYASVYNGENILSDLKEILLDYRPTKIFVSHPGDVNVDHKAYYLFLCIALADLEDEIGRPQVFPYLVHCPGWPLPRHYHPDLPLLPPGQFSGLALDWKVHRLSEADLSSKRDAILCYRSQTRSSAFYLLSFARGNELFGDYPEITLGSAGKGRIFPFSREIPDEEYEPSCPNEAWEASYAVSGGVFYITVGKNKELEKRFVFTAYIFGYKKGVEFAAMPKIMFISRYNVFKMFDKRRPVSSGGVSVQLSKEQVTVGIPLRLLGDPDLMLVSIRTYDRMQPRGAAGFRRIRVNKKGGSDAGIQER